MKKLMIVASAALCATVGLCSIESANIVGYNTVTLKQGYNMLAVNFENVGDTATISIQDLIPGTSTGLDGFTNTSKADQIMVWDAANEGYTIYFLYKNPRNANDAKNGQWCENASGAPIATNTFSTGDSFWFKKYGETESTVSVAGQVSTSETQTLSIGPGYNMIGNAVPVDFNPNSLGQDFWKAALTTGAAGFTNTSRADQIMVYDTDTENYTIYFLYSNARNANDAKNGKWCLNASGAPEVSADASLIPVGKGAWYKHYGENSFTLTIPTSL